MVFASLYTVRSPLLGAPLLARCGLGIAARGPGGRLGVLSDHPAKLSSKGPPPTFSLVLRTARQLPLELQLDWARLLQWVSGPGP